MKLYDENGYLNVRGIRDMGYPFTFITGGRATGKTYGALRTSVEDSLPFVLMRRRQTEVDIINKPDFSPMKPVCRDTGMIIKTIPIVKGISGFQRYNEDGAIMGEPIGYTCALSTIANVRGFDASRLRMIIYDEFIPEKGKPGLRNEADMLFNAYETLNRNRELSGEKPMQLMCLSNANDQTSPIFVQLNLVKRIDRMASSGTEIYTDDKRGILLCLLQKSPISQAKRATALYKLTSGTEFAEMALDNDFSYEERGRIISRPLAEYKPICSIGGITVYSHKSQKLYYVTTHNAGACPRFDTGDTELARFRRSFGWLWKECMADRVEYEEYLCQVLLMRFLS